MVTTALILAGGLGTRLQPVLAGTPKVLAPVRGRPFITFLLDQLASFGITQVILSTGYRAEQVRDVIGERQGSVTIQYSSEPEPLGTAGAIALARELVGDWPLLVMNGDSYCEVDLSAFADWHAEKKARASLMLTQVPNAARFGQVRVDARDQIVYFGEKAATAEAGWISAGIYLLNRDVVDAFPLGRAVSIEREIFPRLIGSGLYGYAGGGQFLDIGTPESLKLAENFLSEVLTK